MTQEKREGRISRSDTAAAESLLESSVALTVIERNRTASDVFRYGTNANI
jgi:hypothetical protein